jgi:hypothetical protein
MDKNNIKQSLNLAVTELAKALKKHTGCELVFALSI